MTQLLTPDRLSRLTRAHYPALVQRLTQLPAEEKVATFRDLCRSDLYFLLVYGLRRPDAANDWCYARCREVQAAPDGHLDLWARGHYKSTIITFALTIQDILRDPETTIGIFSHTRPISKAFLGQIRREFEINERLKAAFSDILYDRPAAEAPGWSLDGGIVVKRRGNPKERTVEAWGLVDGQPTSKHFRKAIYDDTVTRESVTTPEQIEKTTEAWELSLNLISSDGIKRYIGTRYHYHDTYQKMMERGIPVRVYPATKDGTIDGEPVMMSRDKLEEKRRLMGPYTFGCQMLQDPKADSTQGFRSEWLRYYRTIERSGMNVYMMVDAASEKKAGSDYTAMIVLGAASDQNLYVLDIVRDRLNLTERAQRVMQLHRRWRPLAVGWERYGLMADTEYLREVQERESYRFPVKELGGGQPKNDRIRRLVPWFEQGRLYLPQRLDRTNYEGVSQNLTAQFVEQEYEPFPLAQHDDLLDALSRIFDLAEGGIRFPDSWTETEDDAPAYAGAGWAG